MRSMLTTLRTVPKVVSTVPVRLRACEVTKEATFNYEL